MLDLDYRIGEYVRNAGYREAIGLPDQVTEVYELLAQGEYNVNYVFTHPVDGRRLVLRVNMGSQMHLGRQIEYEAHALDLLGSSGRTPKVLYVDGSGQYIDHGILVMEYLPGRYPVYEDHQDMDAVMRCMADIHSIEIPAEEVVYGEPEGVPRDTVKLIAPADPAIAILDECEAMVKTYMDSPLGNEDVKRRLRAMLDRGHVLANSANGTMQSNYPAPADSDIPEVSSPDGYANNCAITGGASDNAQYRCCINTELNSTNFLITEITEGEAVERPEDGSINSEHAWNSTTCRFARLVDWEKPLYGDPAQDLGHLLAPTTTFWKTDTILTQEETDRLIDEYIDAVNGRFNTTGIRERTHRLINITCLRGLTWCAMAWVQYQDAGKAIQNESTRRKLDAYLTDAFLSDIEARLGISISFPGCR